jgi:hypothetical protein
MIKELLLEAARGLRRGQVVIRQADGTVLELSRVTPEEALEFLSRLREVGSDAASWTAERRYP